MKIHEQKPQQPDLTSHKAQDLPQQENIHLISHTENPTSHDMMQHSGQNMQMSQQETNVQQLPHMELGQAVNQQQLTPQLSNLHQQDPMNVHQPVSFIVVSTEFV